MSSANPKPKVRIFVSYSHRNEKLVGRFIDSFTAQIEAARNYEYTLWHDGLIVAGEDWLTEIQTAIRECHLGLVLISTRFLGSKFIKKHELSQFTGDDAKPVIPVFLQPVDFRSQNSLGLERKQCFELKQPGRKRSFAECTTENLKDRFAFKLFMAVEGRVAKLPKGAL